MTGILCLVAIVGIVWLVGIATGGGGKNMAGQGTTAPTTPILPNAPNTPVTPDTPTTLTAPASPNTSTTATPYGTRTNGTRTNGQGTQPTASSGGTPSKTPQNGRRSIHWNGIHLDGSAGDEGCITVINKTGTVGVIESVSFSVISGPGSATARPDVAHCDPTGDPACDGIRLRAGSQCLAGAVLTGDASPNPYRLQPQVRFRYLCVNVEDSPCNEVREWQGPPPTAESPVEIHGGTTDIPKIDAFVAPSSSSSSEEEGEGEEEKETTPEQSPTANQEGSDSAPQESDPTPEEADPPSEEG
ncbi:hypothetical protein [Streptosporangium carneum]|uniref:Uncharacterized protein n=1 Tax=Streptosporangium carneum TaxID=47481 RepID=A0A9W6I385_9ACTN|nr:hypothetical protein [Streptosporangium carneum]GLK11220.1 hypothetical protein GCM10017600_46260 [Streptosporangium carneum]